MEANVARFASRMCAIGEGNIPRFTNRGRGEGMEEAPKTILPRIRHGSNQAYTVETKPTLNFVLLSLKLEAMSS